MKLSSRVDYALSCVLRVADKYREGSAVTVKDVAKSESIEPDYAEQLLIAMKRSGILRSLRGRSGGYILARPPGKISARDIVEAIEGEAFELVCQRPKGRRNRCSHMRDCRVRGFWSDLGNSVESFLEGHTLKQLLTLRRREKGWKG